MKFVVLGTSEFVTHIADAIVESGYEVAALISMLAELRPLNSADLEVYARDRNFPYREVGDINSADACDLIRGYEPDYIFSGWPKIMEEEMLELPVKFVIGTHPTKLPHNRGRHPLHWLIASGIEETALSFFKMDEGVDTGDVLLQVPFRIGVQDDIEDAVIRLNETARVGTLELCRLLSADPDFTGAPQDQDAANYWRRRTPHDATLDLRMPAESLARIVRSYAPPYPGANLLFRKYLLKVAQLRVVADLDVPGEMSYLEPGKIVAIAGDTLRVKAGDRVVDLVCHGPIPPSLDKAKYIHPPAKYMQEWGDTISDLLS